jgi:hypothetical protein
LRPLLIFLPLLFSSCYFREFEGVERHALNERVFENSGGGTLVHSGENIADLKVVYLSDITSRLENRDVFLFSLYIFDRDVVGLENISYSIRINGIAPVKIVEVKNSSSLLENIKISNPWYRNYLVYFMKIDADIFKLKFRYYPYGEIKTNIIKGRGERRDYPFLIKDTIGNREEDNDI